MNQITDINSFNQALSSLPLDQQRQVGARFVQNVLDLTDQRCIGQVKRIAEQSDISPEELEQAYHAVHAIYVSTNPRSGYFKLDYSVQAAHFVAEACMTIVGPTFVGPRKYHIAENAASYCRMARMCAAMHQAGESPDFAMAEKELNQEMESQFEILNDYLKEKS
jgi:hypothetical protein